MRRRQDISHGTDHRADFLGDRVVVLDDVLDRGTGLSVHDGRDIAFDVAVARVFVDDILAVALHGGVRHGASSLRNQECSVSPTVASFPTEYQAVERVGMGVCLRTSRSLAS